MPFTAAQWLTDAGAVAAGYKLYTYIAGTSTPQDTYNAADPNTASANSNPIVLDSAGRALVFLPPDTSYKFILATPSASTPPVGAEIIWTRDGITSNAPYGSTVDVTAIPGENLTAGNIAYLSDGSGSLTAGRWYKCDADVAYSSSIPVRIGFVNTTATTGDTTTIRTDGRITGLSGLSVGSTYYVSATSGALSTTGYRIVGIADTTTSLVMVPSVAAPWNVDINGTAGASIAVGEWVYVVGTSSNWGRASASLPATSTMPQKIGYALTAGSSNVQFTVRTNGRVTGLVGLTAGATYFLATATGTITATAPATYIRRVGVADSTTSLILFDDGPQTLISNFTAVGNVGAGEDNLMSNVLPANSLAYAGQTVRVTAFGFTAANANNKTIKVYFGSTNVLSTGAVAFNNVGWSVQMYIIRSNSTNQKVNATLCANGSSIYNGNLFTTSELMTGDITIKLTGEATADNDIVQAGMFIETLG